ncbi:MAG: DUF1801 domain-containing protein [Longimicrobiales bacterium]
MKQTPMSVEEFLGALTPERRREVDTVRNLILTNLPAGYEEVVSSKMLVYQVPFSEHSDTYNGHPLWYAALASQKTGLSLHLMPLYGDEARTKRLEDAFRAAGKRLDMGKACIRFKSAEKLALEPIAEVVASMPMKRWIEIAKSARSTRAKG